MVAMWHNFEVSRSTNELRLGRVMPMVRLSLLPQATCADCRRKRKRVTPPCMLQFHPWPPQQSQACRYVSSWLHPISQPPCRVLARFPHFGV